MFSIVVLICSTIDLGKCQVTGTTNVFQSQEQCEAELSVALESLSHVNGITARGVCYSWGVPS